MMLSALWGDSYSWLERLHLERLLGRPLVCEIDLRESDYELRAGAALYRLAARGWAP